LTVKGLDGPETVCLIVSRKAVRRQAVIIDKPESQRAGRKPMIRLFNVSIPLATFILLIFETMILLGAFTFATFAVGDLDPLDYLLYDYGALSLLLVVLSFLLGLHFQDLYQQIRVKSRILLLQQLCMVTGAAFLMQGLISYLDRDLRVSVRVMTVGSALVIPAIFLWRIWFGSIAGQMIGQTRLVTIGRSPILAELTRWIDVHPEAGLVVEASAETADRIAALEEVLHRQPLPRLVFDSWGEPDPRLVRELMELQLSGYTMETAASAYEEACGRVSIYAMRPERLVFSSPFVMTTQRMIFHLVLNAAAAGICLVVVIPVMLVTALLLRFGTKGPIWLSSTRAGLHGRVFRIYRFRAEGSGWAARLVRKYRLDGLPEFLNVLKGEIAIVGPRAERPEYREAIGYYIPFYPERYMVRPGMTGWAQIHLNHKAEEEDSIARLEYDLYYIKHMSLGLDFLILLHTLKSMLVSPEAPERQWAAKQVSATTPPA
jgi:lipopolysaccharide/colanic/teichoic acid biosynthesis glycosyltransferase